MNETITERFKVTGRGVAAGWVWMHCGGWVRNPQSRYAAFADYTPATTEELNVAVDRGEFIIERGRYIHVGGILRDWVVLSGGDA